MEPEISLPHPQAPATYPYPEPDRSSPCHHIPLFEDHFDVILPSTPRSSELFLPSRLPTLNPVCTFPVSHTGYMPSPSPLSWFDRPNVDCWGVEIIKLPFMYCFPLTRYLDPLRPTYLLQRLLLEHPQPVFLPRCDRPCFTPIKKREKLYFYKS